MIVVADTSILINLCRVGQGNLLKAIFSEVVIPPKIETASGLDPGEAAALSLAVEIQADAILMDERRGHEIAIELGLRPIGILGILLRAKQSGILPSIKATIDSLRKDAGFWISDSLQEQVLRLAGEN